jgi:hypothetical protein
MLYPGKPGQIDPTTAQAFWVVSALNSKAFFKLNSTLPPLLAVTSRLSLSRSQLITLASLFLLLDLFLLSDGEGVSD